MRVPFFLLVFFFSVLLTGQEFECDGKMYIVSYVQSTGISILTELTEENGSFTSRKIPLSENRRLNCLAFNVLDNHLYALDVDNFELVKIENSGTVTSLGRPANLDTNFIYNAGTISPDGAGIYIIGYNPEFGQDNRYYTINLSRSDLYAGWFGVTGDRAYEIHDFATDPTSGKMYGYDNSEGSLTEMEVGGQIVSYSYQSTGITSMEGLFFNREGTLFGYASNRGIYSINKHSGATVFLTAGPEGTSGDACSCPFTSRFTKDISPREILPCQEFEVTYTFLNALGIGQAWVTLTDTFPEGFEILSIESSIVTERNIVPSSDNVIVLENLIYLMHENDIKVTVRAPSDFLGSFNSQAVHWDFPYAFGEYQYSDDPLTDPAGDPTIATIVSEDEIDFANSIAYSCDGRNAIITSPIDADNYLWNTGSVTPSITVNIPGWYSLETENDCIVYFDSVFIEDFPEAKRIEINGSPVINLGESADLIASLNRGVPIAYQWFTGADTISCTDCPILTVMPSGDTRYEVNITDEEGCVTMGTFDIAVGQIRNFYAATAFSPNGDGINDKFFLQSSAGGIVKHISIFNRWGNEIFKEEGSPLNDHAFGWDGRLKSDYVPSGVYIWMAELEYFDGFKEMRSGTITLIGQE